MSMKNNNNNSNNNSNKLLHVSTPQILWHGGANENGKTDPVYSVDFHPKELILATSGVDGNLPANGCVRLWRLKAEPDFFYEMNDHMSVVNIARFSPCGKMIASASERQIIIYVVPTASAWGGLTEDSSIEKIRLQASMQEIYDLSWSPDSQYIAVGSLDGKSEIIRVRTRDSLSLPSHSSYVQGIAWDPLNQMIATQSADRSCKIHKLRNPSSSSGSKQQEMLRLSVKGHQTIRSAGGTDNSSQNSGTADKSSVEDSNSNKAGVFLYADGCQVPSFFRRLTFSPDGSLLFTPTGIHRPGSAFFLGSSNGANAPTDGRSFCTHVFSRDNLAIPRISLLGLKEPAVAVRCCPRLFKPIPEPSKQDGEVTSWANKPYRTVFAVVTIRAVLVYDSQHFHPILRLCGQHLAAINDAAWSGDGSSLVVCSSDGYLTITRFQRGALGDLLEDDLVPVEVKRAQPCRYDISPTSLPLTASQPSIQEEEEEEDEDEEEDEHEGKTKAKKAVPAPKPVPVRAPSPVAKVVTALAPTTPANTSSTAPSTVPPPFAPIVAQIVSPVAAAPIVSPASASTEPKAVTKENTPSVPAPTGVPPANTSNSDKKRKRVQTTLLGTMDSFLISKGNVGAKKGKATEQNTSAAGDEVPSSSSSSPSLVVTTPIPVAPLCSVSSSPSVVKAPEAIVDLTEDSLPIAPVKTALSTPLLSPAVTLPLALSSPSPATVVQPVVADATTSAPTSTSAPPAKKKRIAPTLISPLTS